MSLHEDIVADFPDAFLNSDDFAIKGIYTPFDSIPYAVNVIIDLSVQRIGFESSIAVEHDEITFSKKDIPCPKRGDRFTDGINEYEFISRISDDGQMATWLVK